MAIAMVAMLAFGGTYAYFTAQATSASDTVTTGQVVLQNNAITLTESKLVPTMELLGPDSEISVKNSSNVETYIFVKFSLTGMTLAESIQNDGDATLTPTLSTTNWKALSGETGVYWYKAPAVETATDITFCTSIKFDAKSESLDDNAGSLMNKTITVKIQSASVQATGLANETAAFAEVTFHE